MPVFASSPQWRLLLGEGDGTFIIACDLSQAVQYAIHLDNVCDGAAFQGSIYQPS